MSTTDKWTNYTNDDGQLRWTVDYYRDGVVASFVEANYEDALACAEAELDEYETPETDEDVKELQRLLAARAAELVDAADHLEDGAEAAALFRRARVVGRAAGDLDISDALVESLQQDYGDDDLHEMEEMLALWDDAHGERSYDEMSGRFISATDAWKRALNDARSGGSHFELVADVNGLTLESHGYGCDIRDIALRVVDLQIVNIAREIWDGEVQTHELAVLESAPIAGLLAVLPIARSYYFSGAATELTGAAHALAGLTETDIARVAETAEVLGESWTGDFDELVLAAVSLTVDRALA